MTTAVATVLTDGGLSRRIKCLSCGHMVPMYVDRGDGRPLRLHPWSKDDPKSLQPDPALDFGICVMATDVLSSCPVCGLANNPRQAWGRWTEVKGTWSPEPCGPECREATGDKCRCSCRGANHGIA